MMSSCVEMPEVKPLHGSVVRLVSDWCVDGVLQDGRRFRVEVRAGFEFDGASIPRCLWRVCGHPLEAPRIAAALAHDWIYAAQVCDRGTADAIYRELCRMVGIAWICRTAEYKVLRLFGWAAWRGHTHADAIFALAHGALETNGERCA